MRTGQAAQGKGAVLLAHGQRSFVRLLQGPRPPGAAAEQELRGHAGNAYRAGHRGSQAFEYLQEQISAGHAVAAMVLDLTVPGELGGEEAIAPIRTLTPSLPVFVASGYADDPVMANPQAYGFTASISKPFGRIELARMLNLHMNGC